MSYLAKSQRPVRWIRCRDLSVLWVQSQRPMRQRKVDAIAENIDPDAIGVIAVSPMGDGSDRYHIIDGQHRVAAIKQVWGESEYVPCQIIEDADSPEQAAETWLIMNTERSSPNAFERFKVALTAERETETAVNTIIEHSPYHLGKGGITAVNTCIRIYENQGGPALAWVLETAHRMWGDSEVTLPSHVIEGLAVFLAKFRDEDDGKDFDTDRLVEQVSKRYTPSSLMGSARAARETFRGSIAINVMRIMVQCYNKRLRLEENYLTY